MNIVTKHRIILLNLVAELRYEHGLLDLVAAIKFKDKKGVKWGVLINDSVKEQQLFFENIRPYLTCPAKSVTILYNGFPCLIVGSEGSSGYLDIRLAIKAVRWQVKQMRKKLEEIT